MGQLININCTDKYYDNLWQQLEELAKEQKRVVEARNTSDLEGNYSQYLYDRIDYLCDRIEFVQRQFDSARVNQLLYDKSFSS